MGKPDLPLSAAEVLDLYFLENRARLLEIASFLDRLDRAGEAATAREDCRYHAFIAGLRLVVDKVDRTAAVQAAFSDPTTEPLASAKGLPAIGAWDGHADH